MKIILTEEQGKKIVPGQFYMVHGGTYLLCQVGCRSVCIINIRSGNRLCEPVVVDNVSDITAEELNRICGYYETFRLNAEIEE